MNIFNGLMGIKSRAEVSRNLAVSCLLLLTLAACIEDERVVLVKGGKLDSCPSKTLGEMAQGYMGSPSWEGNVSEDGQDFVNLRGDITFNGKPISAMMQFFVDIEGGTFHFNALEFNEIPQVNLLAIGLLNNMCREG